MSDNFCDSPMKPIAPIPAGYKGGPGVYNGEPGFEPKRTMGPDSVPEKTRDGSIPTPSGEAGPKS